MKIVFSELDRKLVLTLPVTPSDFEWGKSRKREVHEALYQDIDDVGNYELGEYTIESFAPDHGAIYEKKYAFQNTATAGRNVIATLEKWLDNKTALRMIATAKDGRTLVNVIVKIIVLKLKLDRPGDYVYSMQITEHVPTYQ
ncbi:MAG: hypothetical protein ABS942_11145 [Solibacillus sp.]